MTRQRPQQSAANIKPPHQEGHGDIGQERGAGNLFSRASTRLRFAGSLYRIWLVTCPSVEKRTSIGAPLRAAGQRVQKGTDWPGRIVCASGVKFRDKVRLAVVTPCHTYSLRHRQFAGASVAIWPVTASTTWPSHFRGDYSTWVKSTPTHLHRQS